MSWRHGWWSECSIFRCRIFDFFSLSPKWTSKALDWTLEASAFRWLTEFDCAWFHHDCLSVSAGEGIDSQEERVFPVQGRLVLFCCFAGKSGNRHKHKVKRFSCIYIYIVLDDRKLNWLNFGCLWWEFWLKNYGYKWHMGREQKDKSYTQNLAQNAPSHARVLSTHVCVFPEQNCFV